MSKVNLKPEVKLATYNKLRQEIGELNLAKLPESKKNALSEAESIDEKIDILKEIYEDLTEKGVIRR